MSVLLFAVIVVLVLDIVFLVSYVLNLRWYCDALDVPREIRPWYAR